VGSRLISKLGLPYLVGESSLESDQLLAIQSFISV
jgi:hypothetical protein